MQSDRQLYINDFTPDSELYPLIYYSIFKRCGISRRDEYQFIYDEFLEHLKSDCTKLVEKHFDPTKNSKLHLYKIEVFKKIFMQHLDVPAWHDKIMKPHKCPETIKRLRNYKLEKIKENYGN